MAIPTVDEVWADFDLDGSAHEPVKQDIRRSLRFIQAMATTNGMKTYPTKAAMVADTTQPNGQAALIYADPTDSNNYPTVWTWDDGGNVWVEGIDRIEPIREQQVTDGLRLVDLENDSLSVDFTDTAQFEIINTAISNPSTRFTWSVVGGNIVYNQSYSGLLLIGYLTNYTGIRNRSFSVQFTPASVEVNNAGFGICFNPSSASVIDPTNHVMIKWRALNGIVQAVRQNGSTLVTSLGVGGQVDGNSAPNCLYVAGDVLRMDVLIDNDGTSGTFTRYKNGAFVSSFQVNGLPVGWLGAMSANAAAATPVGTFGAATVSKIFDAAKRIYLDPSVGSSGAGTEASPFQNIRDALLYVNESGRRLDMVLKAGVYAGAIEINTGRYDSISIRGDQGRTPIISPYTTLTSGWIKTPSYTNIWQRQHVFGGVTGSTVTSGHISDASQPDGTWGFQIYSRQTPFVSPSDTTLDTKLTAMDAKPTGEGWYCSSPNASGTMYIKPKNNIDPNTLSLIRGEWLAGINLIPQVATLAGMADVFISGVEIAHPYGHGILAGRVRGTIEDAFIYGAGVLNAISPNLMTGTIAQCRGLRCFNDGINHTDPADLTPAPRTAKLRVLGCDMQYMIQGDGLSNHQDQDVEVIGGTYANNGKCGIVPVGNAVIVGARIFGNVIGVQALTSSAAGSESQYVSVRDCHLWNNQLGYNATTPDSALTTLLEILGGSCTGSTQALFQLRNDATTGPADLTNKCLIRARNLARSGNTAYRNDTAGVHGQVGFIEDLAIPITSGAF